MYAVIKAGGHQYRVKEGDSLTVDKLNGNVGDSHTYSEVLAIGSGDSLNFGKPLVSGASVVVEIKEQKRADKVTIFKYRRRKNYKVTKGHKQPITVIEVKKINQ